MRNWLTGSRSYGINVETITQGTEFMIYLFGGGGGFLGKVFKGVTSVFTGPEKVKEPKSLQPEVAQKDERKSQEEALRKERALLAKRSGRSKTLLSGGGSTAGIQTQQKTLLGSK